MKATTEQAEQQSKALAKLLRDLDDQEKRRTESISALASSLLALGAARPAGRHGDVRWSRAKAHADTVWAPLADTMTLLASVFFVVMIAMFIASERSKALQLKAESQIGDVQRQKGAKLERAEALIAQVQSKLKALKHVDSGVTVENGVVRLPDTVLFGINSADVSEEGRALPERKVAPVLAGLGAKGPRIVVSGHADARQVRDDPCGMAKPLPAGPDKQGVPG